MDWAKAALLFVLLAFAAGSVNGQNVYYDDTDGINFFTVRPGNARSPVTTILNETVSSGRRMCLSRHEFLYTKGGDELFNSAGGVIFTTPDNAVIKGLDCCCQLVIVTYTLNECIHAIAWSIDTPSIRVEHELATVGTDGDFPAGSKVVVKCSISTRLIVIVSRRFIWIIKFRDLTRISKIRLRTGPDPFRQPECVACKSIGGDQLPEYVIFVSVSGGTSIFSVTVDLTNPNALSIESQFITSSDGAVFINCIAYDEETDLLYFIGSPGQGYFYIEIVGATDLRDLRTRLFRGNGGLPDTVHGLNLCDHTCMDRDCTDFRSSCTDTRCGFSFYPGDECQCENYDIDNCEYTDTDQREECSNDTTPPTCVNVPRGINETVEQGAAGAVVSWTEPSCDDLSGTANVTMRSHLPAMSFVVGVTTVTYTCTDAAGNSEMCQFNVTVNERSTTSIEFCPDSMTVITCNDGERVSWDTPMSFSDGMRFMVESSHSPGDFFQLGTTTVFYSVEEGQSGKQEVCNFRITVKEANSCPAAPYVYIVIAVSAIILVVFLLLVILKMCHDKRAKQSADDQPSASNQGIQMQPVDKDNSGITNNQATGIPQAYTTTVGSEKYPSKIYNAGDSSSSSYQPNGGYETVE